MIRCRWSTISHLLTFYIICVGLCQDQCLRKCWKGMPGTQVVGGLQVQNVTSENDCKDLCANNGTCVGIDWNNGCWLQMTPNNTYNPRSDFNHWDLVDCSDDCLSYCWKPLKNNYGFYVADFRGSIDENRCKFLCRLTTNCIGVDYIVIENGCWLINFIGSIYNNRTGVHHWDIMRDVATNCQTKTTTNPAITSISTVSTTSAGQAGVTGVIQNVCETKDSKDLKSAVIALAVLSGVFLMVIIVLAVVLFRTMRLQRDQNSSSNVKEPEETYNSLELDTRMTRSQQPDYTDLQAADYLDLHV